MSDLSQRVLDLSKQIQDNTHADHKTQLMSAKEDTLYEQLLPEGLTVDQYKAFQAHHTDLVAAAAHAVSHKALPLAQKHSDMKALSFELPMPGKDSMSAEWQRSVQVPNRLADGTTDGTKEKFGAVSVKISTYATGNRGALAIVKKMVSDEAREKLGG